jgi:protein subunit release factor A
MLGHFTKGRCEVKYEPKTTAEQRRELVQYLCNVNHRGAKVQRICDDLAACEAALAEEQARIAELEAMVRELVEATEAEYHVVAGDQYHMLCPGSAIKVNTTCSWIVMATGERSSHRNKDRAQILNAARAKALALLNSGNEGNSADQ